jgi:hypothetical protein
VSWTGGRNIIKEAGRRSPNDRRPRRARREIGGKALRGTRRYVRLPESQDGGSSALVVMHRRASHLGFQVPGGPLVSHAVSGPLPPKLVGPAPPPALSSRMAACRGRPSRPPRKSAPDWTSAAPPGLSHTRWPSPPAHRGEGGHTPGRLTTRTTMRVGIGVPPGGHWYMTAGAQHTPPSNGSRWRNARAATPIPGLTVGNPTGGWS